MAEIAFDRFAAAFSARLAEIGYSLRAAEQKWPGANRAMLSRATNARTLSAGSFLLLCEYAGLDPYAFLERRPARRTTMRAIRKSLAAQMVTADDKRETSEKVQ